MTPEELMIPRVEVMMDYPNSPFKVGDILTNTVDTNYRINDTTLWLHAPYVSQYPHIFQPIPWYKYRKPEDMPEYVKFPLNGHVLRVYPDDFKAGKVCERGMNDYWYLVHATPATLEDYTAYQKQKI